MYGYSPPVGVGQIVSARTAPCAFGYVVLLAYIRNNNSQKYYRFVSASFTDGLVLCGVTGRHKSEDKELDGSTLMIHTGYFVSHWKNVLILSSLPRFVLACGGVAPIFRLSGVIFPLPHISYLLTERLTSDRDPPTRPRQFLTLSDLISPSN